jgi:glycosyl transferase family 87
LTRRSSAITFIWALMAVLNLSAGIVMSSWPERQTDLQSVQRWGGIWLFEGANVYRVEGEAPDYPPHAIVVLSPLAILADQVFPVWVSFNLLLAALSVYLAVRATRPAKTAAERALPLLMFLCWGGFRTLQQFTLLTLTLGLASMVLAHRRPNWSGIGLGLALMKPQVAAPFVLWALFTRRLRVLGIACAVVAAGFLLYCVRAEADPFDVVSSYLGILRSYYLSDASGLIGLAQVRPLVSLVVPNGAFANAVAGAIALGLLAGICVLGFSESRRHAAIMYSAPALAGIWSLLTFYHLTYGFLLLLPTATLLLWADDLESLRMRKRIFWLLQAALMFDVPGLSERYGHMLPLPDGVGALLKHADRLLMIALFVSVMALGFKRARREGLAGLAGI